MQDVEAFEVHIPARSGFQPDGTGIYRRNFDVSRYSQYPA